MNFLLAFIFIFVGLMVSSFTLIPILIIFRFGIPYTKEFEKNGDLVKNSGITKRYFVSVLLLTCVFLAILAILYKTTTSGFNGYLLGAVAAMVFGISKTGKNEDNLRDYMQTNSSFFKKRSS